MDDLLGTGCPSSVAYQKLEARLKEAFNFREWHDTESMEYCGASLVHNSEGWKLSHESYYKKLKPITVDKNRGPADLLDSKDVTQLRGLLGSLQWPAVQSSPHLQASASLLAGQLSTGTVETINEANRLLRFAKSNADVSLDYKAICPLEDLRLVCSFDAAFGVRRDGASQGGYITMLVPKGFFFFFPPHLFPRLSVALHDCFTGQSPGARLARRAKVQGPGKLRQGGEATGGRRVWRGFRQELAPVDGIGVDVVEIGCSFTKKGGCEGGHGCMCQRGGPSCGESGRYALLEDGGCLSGSGSCQVGDEGGSLLTPSAPHLYGKHDQAAALVVEEVWVGSFFASAGIL